MKKITTTALGSSVIINSTPASNDDVSPRLSRITSSPVNLPPNILSESLTIKAKQTLLIWSYLKGKNKR